MARQLEKCAQKFNYTFFWCYGPLMWYFPPNNTGFDECWGYCISCKVDISIFHRNKGRACCIDGAWHAFTTTWLSVTAKGLSSRMVSTACGPDPLVRADDSQHKHSTGSRFAILTKGWLFWGMYYWSNLCLHHTKLLAIDAWKSLQKILRRGEVYCREISTRQSQRPNNWRV